MRRLVTPLLVGTFCISMVVAAGCRYDDAECKTDDECRSTRICVDGICQFALDRDAHSPDTGDESPRDTGADPVDTRDPAPPDTRDPAPPDTDRRDTVDPVPIDVDEDTGDDDTAPPPDVGPADTGIRPDGPVRTDTGPVDDLTCHEFATCQTLMCDQYDYNCKDEYSRRTPDAELRKLDDRQTCVRKHCRGKQGQARIDCTYKHCQTEFNACVHTDGDRTNLTCSEFHGCLHLCNGRKNPQVCRKRCRDDATFTAKQDLQRYHRCFRRNCQGKEGRAAWKCARNHCSDELSACWGC